MVVSLALVALSLGTSFALRPRGAPAPARWRRALPWLAAPSVYVALAALRYLYDWRFEPLIPAPHRAMRLLDLLFLGFGLWLPLASLAALAPRSGRRPPPLEALSLSAALSAVALSSWALFVEPSQLAPRRYTVTTPRAPSAPLTILHVSDLQTDGPCRREARANALARAASPDLVVFTGDLLNDVADPVDRPARVASARAFVRSLHARLGVFLVLGDWDGWGDHWPSALAEITRGTSARVLRNETVSLRAPDGTRVTLHGVLDSPPELGRTDVGEASIPDLRATPGLRLVAVHNPDTVALRPDLLPPRGADLVLAGHTHGGQVVLPFVGALTTHTVLGLAGGLHAVRGVPLVISRGIGMRGGGAPRVRFLCPPEVGTITVRR